MSLDTEDMVVHEDNLLQIFCEICLAMSLVGLSIRPRWLSAVTV